MKTWINENIRTLPLLMQAGLLLLGAFGALDIVYHLLPATAEQALDLYLGRDALLLHLGILLGMVVTMLGLLTKGVIRKAHTVSRFSHKV